MPQISHASADEDFREIIEAADAELAGEQNVAPPSRKPSTMALWPETARMMVRRAFDPLRTWLRSTWLYRRTLRGPVPDRIVFHPQDPTTRRLDDADLMFRGRFRLAGETLEVKQGSVFDAAPLGAAFAGALHGFDWLRHLEAAGSEPSRELAKRLTAEWLARNARYTEPAWQPEIIAERFFNLAAHGRFVLLNSDVLWRSRLFVSLRNQARVLARTIEAAPDGLARFDAAAGLALAGLCLADTRSTNQGLARLTLEIGRQILPDGGMIERSPETLLHAFLALTMVQQALTATNKPVPDSLRSARDRMAPMIRFFRLGDGALAAFNGGNECDARLVSALLASDDAKGMPFGHARYSAYQRMAAGRSFVLMDTGIAPPGAFSIHAHAGCLSFEMSSGPHRMIVNCGAAQGDTQWDGALRATAAHSTLTLADTSSASVLPEGVVRSALGPRLIGGPTMIETSRNENAQGIVVEATHNGYAQRFGFTHQRRLALSPKGTVLTGADRLAPVEARKAKRKSRAAVLPFAIRFHVHPDVRLSLAQGEGSVILKLPNGEGWRFRTDGGALAIEESIYFGSGAPRHAEQLVVSGTVRDEPVEIAWVFEQMGAI